MSLLTLDHGAILVFATPGALVRVGKQLDGRSGVGRVGGGFACDLFTGRVPVAFSDELCATPTLIGATWAVLSPGSGQPKALVALAGVPICFGVPMLDLRRGARAPMPRGRSSPCPVGDPRERAGRAP